MKFSQKYSHRWTTKKEIHDFALEIIFGFIRQEDYEILHINKDYGINTSFICKKGEDIHAFVVKSDIVPNQPSLTFDEKNKLIKYTRKNGYIPVFCPVSFGATNATRFEKGIALVGDAYYCNFKGFEYFKDMSSPIDHNL